MPKKSNISLLFILFVVPIIFSSCTKDDDPITDLAKMTASIDGSDWNGSVTKATISNNTLILSGISVSGSSITITIYDGFEEGTYPLTQTTFGVAVYQEVTGGEGFTTNAGPDAGGQITITEIDKTNKTISGYFSFDVKEQSSQEVKSITDGSIDKIGYTMQ